MRYSVNKWNVQLTINGKTGIPDYYGYKTKAEAETVAQRYRIAGYNAVVIRYS
jgi:hypothetical protein